MPHKLFSPQPATLSHFQDQLNDVSVAFTIDDALFDIKDKSSRWLQYAKELVGLGHEPVHVVIRPNAAVGASALVSVRR